MDFQSWITYPSDDEPKVTPTALGSLHGLGQTFRAAQHFRNSDIREKTSVFSSASLLICHAVQEAGIEHIQHAHEGRGRNTLSRKVWVP